MTLKNGKQLGQIKNIEYLAIKLGGLEKFVNANNHFGIQHKQKN